VLYSPEGIDADDVIRDEMARIPTARAVIVVTDDRAIRDDARKLGANLIDSSVFAELLWGR
jgi:rRNA-processing protein FCF1